MGSCSMRLPSGKPELYQQSLFAALRSTILFGAALVWALRAERRRAIIEPRLKAISITTASADSVVVSLRRTRPHRQALPAVVLSRLDNALAATGNRITLPQLAATAIIAPV